MVSLASSPLPPAKWERLNSLKCMRPWLLYLHTHFALQLVADAPEFYILKIFLPRYIRWAIYMYIYPSMRVLYHYLCMYICPARKQNQYQSEQSGSHIGKIYFGMDRSEPTIFMHRVPTSPTDMNWILWFWVSLRHFCKYFVVGCEKSDHTTQNTIFLAVTIPRHQEP